MDSLTLKRHNSFQNKNDRKGTLRTLTFKLQQEVWKFSDIPTQSRSVEQRLTIIINNQRLVLARFVSKNCIFAETLILVYFSKLYSGSPTLA